MHVHAILYLGFHYPSREGGTPCFDHDSFRAETSETNAGRGLENSLRRKQSRSFVRFFVVQCSLSLLLVQLYTNENYF